MEALVEIVREFGPGGAYSLIIIILSVIIYTQRQDNIRIMEEFREDRKANNDILERIGKTLEVIRAIQEK